jgi:hypothetical protein
MLLLSMSPIVLFSRQSSESAFRLRAGIIGLLIREIFLKWVSPLLEIYISLYHFFLAIGLEINKPHLLEIQVYLNHFFP